MDTLVAASLNKNKIREIGEITKGLDIKVISRSEAGISDDVEVAEDGDTFEENSLKKAREISALCGKPAIADDSGLAVDALCGEPGVNSAIYAGEERDDKKNRDKLLNELNSVPYEKRTARFVAVISVAHPDGSGMAVRGECEGHVAFGEKGAGGFGYDSIFIPLGYDRTFAEMSQEEKNKTSHRAKALAMLKDKMEKG